MRVGVGVQPVMTPDADKVLSVLLAIADIADPEAMSTIVQAARDAGAARRERTVAEWKDLAAQQAAHAKVVADFEAKSVSITREFIARAEALDKRDAALAVRDAQTSDRDAQLAVKAGQLRNDQGKLAQDRKALDEEAASLVQKDRALSAHESGVLLMGKQVEEMRAEYETKLAALRGLVA